MKKKISKIISKLVMAAVGIVLIIKPGEALTGIIRFLGVALLLIGLFGIISFIASPSKGIIAGFFLVLSVLAALAALIPLFKPSLIVAIFPFVIGITLAINGIADSIEAVSLRSITGVWIIPLVLSLLAIVGGCVIAFYPFATMDLLVRIVGAILVYNAVVGLFMAVTYKPPVRSDGVIDITEANS